MKTFQQLMSEGPGNLGKLPSAWLKVLTTVNRMAGENSKIDTLGTLKVTSGSTYALNKVRALIGQADTYAGIYLEVDGAPYALVINGGYGKQAYNMIAPNGDYFKEMDRKKMYGTDKRVSIGGGKYKWIPPQYNQFERRDQTMTELFGRMPVDTPITVYGITQDANRVAVSGGRKDARNGTDTDVDNIEKLASAKLIKKLVTTGCDKIMGNVQTDLSTLKSKVMNMADLSIDSSNYAGRNAALKDIANIAREISTRVDQMVSFARDVSRSGGSVKGYGNKVTYQYKDLADTVAKL
jgi:hypothetical protein